MKHALSVLYSTCSSVTNQITAFDLIEFLMCDIMMYTVVAKYGFVAT